MSNVWIISKPGEWKEMNFQEPGYREMFADYREASRIGDERYAASHDTNAVKGAYTWTCPLCNELHTQKDFWHQLEAIQYRLRERRGSDSWRPEGEEAPPGSTASISLIGSWATYLNVKCKRTGEPYRICLASGTPG